MFITLTHAQNARPPTFLVAASAAHKELGHQGCARQGEAGGDKDALGGSDLQKVAPEQAKGHHEHSHVAGPLQGDLPHLEESTGVSTHLSARGPAERGHACPGTSRPRSKHTSATPRKAGAVTHGHRALDVVRDEARLHTLRVVHRHPQNTPGAGDPSAPSSSGNGTHLSGPGDSQINDRQSRARASSVTRPGKDLADSGVSELSLIRPLGDFTED